MTTTATTTRYTVIYRTGGTENFKWHKTLLSGTNAQMQDEATKLRNSGYKAIVHKTAQLDAIGLPDTWE